MVRGTVLAELSGSVVWSVGGAPVTSVSAGWTSTSRRKDHTRPLRRRQDNERNDHGVRRHGGRRVGAVSEPLVNCDGGHFEGPERAAAKR
jgi:hypothetical protein